MTYKPMTRPQTDRACCRSKWVWHILPQGSPSIFSTVVSVLSQYVLRCIPVYLAFTSTIRSWLLTWFCSQESRKTCSLLLIAIETNGWPGIDIFPHIGLLDDSKSPGPPGGVGILVQPSFTRPNQSRTFWILRLQSYLF